MKIKVCLGSSFIFNVSVLTYVYVSITLTAHVGSKWHKNLVHINGLLAITFTVAIKNL